MLEPKSSDVGVIESSGAGPGTCICTDIETLPPSDVKLIFAEYNPAGRPARTTVTPMVAGVVDSVPDPGDALSQVGKPASIDQFTTLCPTFEADRLSVVVEVPKSRLDGVTWSVGGRGPAAT